MLASSGQTSSYDAPQDSKPACETQSLPDTGGITELDVMVVGMQQDGLQERDTGSWSVLPSLHKHNDKSSTNREPCPDAFVAKNGSPECVQAGSTGSRLPHMSSNEAVDNSRNGDTRCYIGDGRGPAAFLMDICDPQRSPGTNYIARPMPGRRALPPEDLEYARMKGCLTLPSQGLQDELKRCYFHYIYPLAPILDACTVLRQYGEGEISLLLLWLHRPNMRNILKGEPTANELALNRLARRWTKSAALNATHILNTLIAQDLLGSVQALITIAIVPPMQVHLLDSVMSTPIKRRMGKHNIQLCMVVLGELRKWHTAADKIYKMFEFALKHVSGDAVSGPASSKIQDQGTESLPVVDFRNWGAADWLLTAARPAWIAPSSFNTA